MFSIGRATSCAAPFEQLCGPRAAVNFCVFTLALCECHVEASCGGAARGVLVHSQAVRDFTTLARA